MVSRDQIWRVGFVACALSIWLALAVGVSAEDEGKGSTIVSVNMTEVLEVLEWPETAHADYDLVPEQYESIGPFTFKVLANVEWEIQIASDSPNGELREYDVAGGSYLASAKTTANSLEWRRDGDQEWTALSKNGVSLFGKQGPTGSQGRDFSFYLGFLPTFDDMRLSREDREYRVEVTYTVGVRY